jgi:hypothetical protein
MQTSRKKIGKASFLESAGAQNRNSHKSGLTMSRLLFARVDRLANELRIIRSEFMAASTTAILDMCRDRKKRVLPALVVRYDKVRKPKDKDFQERWDLVRSQLDNPFGAQRAGTYFTVETEERISEIVKQIGWSRNQFISEALRTLVDMCEDPEARRLPLVVILHDAAVNVSPSRLR